MPNKSPKLHLLSYNVGAIPYVIPYAGKRLKRIAGELSRARHDIVALQEVWSPFYVRLLRKEAGFPNVVRHAHGIIGSGLVTLTRFPVVRSRLYPFSIRRAPHRIFYGDGDGEFSVSQEITLGRNRGSVEAEIRDIVVADFDANGRPDVAAACHTSGNVVVLINQSKDAALPQRFKREIYHFEAGKPRALCAEDLNQDGALDIVVALWERNEVALLIHR